jgi:predicted dehydrogenase
MLDAGGLDAVVIATPLDLHARHTLDALDAGLHGPASRPQPDQL